MTSRNPKVKPRYLILRMARAEAKETNRDVDDILRSWGEPIRPQRGRPTTRKIAGDHHFNR